MENAKRVKPYRVRPAGMPRVLALSIMYMANRGPTQQEAQRDAEERRQNAPKKVTAS